MLKTPPSLLVLFACCFVLFFSCEREAPQPNKGQALQVAAGQNDDCKLALNQWFPVSYNTNPPNDPEPDYEFELLTGPYATGDCLCRVSHYKFEFQDLPDTSLITITDINGTEIPFDFFDESDPTGTTGDYIRIPNVGTLDDPFLTVFMDFDGNPEVLMRSGGLCIIENYGGGDPSLPQNLPLKDQVPNPPPATDSTTHVYIPTSITLPW